MAVGVDADLFDKVAEKLATSGDLEKAWDFGVWLTSVLQCISFFGLDLSNRFARC